LTRSAKFRAEKNGAKRVLKKEKKKRKINAEQTPNKNSASQDGGVEIGGKRETAALRRLNPDERGE